MIAGLTPVKIKEATYQAVAYLGIARLYPFIVALNEVLLSLIHIYMFVSTRGLVQARVGKSDISVRRHYPVTFHRSRL